MNAGSGNAPAWQHLPLMDVEAIESEFRRSHVRIEPPRELWYVESTTEAHRVVLALSPVDIDSSHDVRIVDMGYDGLAIATGARLHPGDLVEVVARDSSKHKILFRETLEIKNVRSRKIEIDSGRRLSVFGSESLHKKHSWLYKTLLDSYSMTHGGGR